MSASSRLGSIVGCLVAASVSLAAAADFGALIEQLDSSDFGSRQEASRQLGECGPEAIPILERTVAAGSREASARALDLLKQRFQRGDIESKDSAREALARLAESNHARTAQRARDVLNPPPERTGALPWGDFPIAQRRFNNVQFNNLQLQLGANPGGIAAGVRRVSYSEINGRRGVEIADADRVVKMDTWPGGNIEIAITEKRNGRDATRTISAKDRDELVRKDAETAKLYDQFHRPGGNLPGLPPGLAPAIPAGFNRRPMLR